MVEFFTLDHLHKLIVDNAHRIRRLNFDVVVHIPRSGTLPAALIATYFCKPLQSVDEFCINAPVNPRKSEYKQTQTILLVDDSVRTGVQMHDAAQRIKDARPDVAIKGFCVYDNQAGAESRAFHPAMSLLRHNSAPYFTPWFLWKTSWVSEVAFDMDGVLCRDCSEKENDDGPLYREFLEIAELKFKPLAKKNISLGAIVTGRLEKYRPQTVDWLHRHGIKYHRLIMCPAKDPAERKAMEPAKWKGAVYRDAPYTLFVESSAKEAPVIASVSKKSVYCVDTGEIHR